MNCSWVLMLSLVCSTLDSVETNHLWVCSALYSAEAQYLTVLRQTSLLSAWQFVHIPDNIEHEAKPDRSTKPKVQTIMICTSTEIWFMNTNVKDFWCSNDHSCSDHSDSWPLYLSGVQTKNDHSFQRWLSLCLEVRRLESHLLYCNLSKGGRNDRSNSAVSKHIEKIMTTLSSGDSVTLPGSSLAWDLLYGIKFEQNGRIDHSNSAVTQLPCLEVHWLETYYTALNLSKMEELTTGVETDRKNNAHSFQRWLSYLAWVWSYCIKFEQDWRNQPQENTETPQNYSPKKEQIPKSKRTNSQTKP